MFYFTSDYMEIAGSSPEAFNNKKAFIPFITCGAPDLKVTEKIVYEMAENCADLIVNYYYNNDRIKYRLNVV